MQTLPKPTKSETVDLAVLKEWPGAVKSLSQAVESFPVRLNAEIQAVKIASQANFVLGAAVGLVVGVLATLLLERLLPRSKS